MKLFRKHRQDRLSDLNDEQASRIASKIVNGQKRLASFLENRVNRLPKWVLMLGLALFCVLIATYCISLLLRGLK